MKMKLIFYGIEHMELQANHQMKSEIFWQGQPDAQATYTDWQRDSTKMHEVGPFSKKMQLSCD